MISSVACMCKGHATLAREGGRQSLANVCLCTRLPVGVLPFPCVGLARRRTPTCARPGGVYLTLIRINHTSKKVWVKYELSVVIERNERV